MVVRAGQFVPHLSRKCFRLHDVIYFVVWKKLRCFVSHAMYIDWQSKQLKDCSRSWITLRSHWLLLACVIHLGLCLEFSIVQSVWVRRGCWHSKSLSIRIKYFLLLKLYCICTVFAMYSNQKNTCSKRLISLCFEYWYFPYETSWNLIWGSGIKILKKTRF